MYDPIYVRDDALEAAMDAAYDDVVSSMTADELRIWNSDFDSLTPDEKVTYGQLARNVHNAIQDATSGL